MNRKICAYCKKPDTMTREHLWPKSLHRRLFATNKQAANAFWLAFLQKEIPKEPQIRDVCGKCNNVILSELDQYICRLFDSTLINIPNRYEQVQFEHEYHLLKRWLLKMSFNSARINKSVDLPVLEAVLPYILGKNDSLGKSIQLFLELSYPEEIPEDELSKQASLEGISIFEPTLNRVGHMLFRVSENEKILRTVHLRSFSFYLAFFKPGESRAVQDYFADTFTQCMSETVLLRPSKPKVLLKCNGMGAWNSIKESRNFKLAL